MIEKSQSPSFKELDCAGCRTHLTCVKKITGEPIVVSAPQLPDLEIDPASWETVVDVVHRKVGYVPVHNCLLEYSICPESVIDATTEDYIRAYQSTGGVSRLKTLDEYFDQPAAYVELCQFIDGTMERLKGLVDNG